MWNEWNERLPAMGKSCYRHPAKALRIAIKHIENFKYHLPHFTVSVAMLNVTGRFRYRVVVSAVALQEGGSWLETPGGLCRVWTSFPCLCGFCPGPPDSFHSPYMHLEDRWTGKLKLPFGVNVSMNDCAVFRCSPCSEEGTLPFCSINIGWLSEPCLHLKNEQLN